MKLFCKVLFIEYYCKMKRDHTVYQILVYRQNISKTGLNDYCKL